VSERARTFYLKCFCQSAVAKMAVIQCLKVMPDGFNMYLMYQLKPTIMLMDVICAVRKALFWLEALVFRYC
jgi:hypothetical protein